MGSAFYVTAFLLLSSLLSLWLSQRAMYKTRAKVLRRQKHAKDGLLDVVSTGDVDLVREALQPFLRLEHEDKIARYRRIEGISLAVALLSIVTLFVMNVVRRHLAVW